MVEQWGLSGWRHRALRERARQNRAQWRTTIRRRGGAGASGEAASLEGHRLFELFPAADAPHARPGSLVVRHDVAVGPRRGHIAGDAVEVSELHEGLALLRCRLEIGHRVGGAEVVVNL